MQEAGVKDFAIPGWFALLAPKGTPRHIVNQLREASAFAMADPAVQEFYRANAITAVEMTPEALAKFIAEESEKYRGYVDRLGIKSSN